VTELVEIALFTGDVAATATFYRGLVGSPPVSEWTGAAIFVAGSAKLNVHERAAAMDDGPANEDHFAISVANLAKASLRTCANPAAGSSSSPRRKSSVQDDHPSTGCAGGCEARTQRAPISSRYGRDRGRGIAPPSAARRHGCSF